MADVRQFRRNLEAANIEGLEVFPGDSRDFDSIDPDIPLVILIHGYQGSAQDMTDPSNEYAYDLQWRPRENDRGWHVLPPINPLNDAFLIDLSQDPIEESPQRNPPETDSWFNFFSNQNGERNIQGSSLNNVSFPVVTFSQGDFGKNAPLDAIEGQNIGASLQLNRVMEEVENSLLTGRSECRRILLIGHSRGGVIARKYILEALNGNLDSEGDNFHRNIVIQRVRFMGTLNSPHLGNNLTNIPDIVRSLDSVFTASIALMVIADPIFAIAVAAIPEIADFGIMREVVDSIMRMEELRDDTLAELAPGSPMLQSLNNLDFILRNHPDPQVSDSLTNIVRASTSGNEPALLNIFGPYIFDISSFIPDTSRLFDIGSWIDAIGDFFSGRDPEPPRLFRWTSNRMNLPYSPVTDAVGDPFTLMKTTLQHVVWSQTFPELIAQNPLTSGGDFVVSNESARLPHSNNHLVVQRHHWNALWLPIYKEFIFGVIENDVLPLFCFPIFTFRIGENIVELKWNTRPLWKYQIVRNIEGDPNHDIRSPLISKGLYYDDVMASNTYRFLVNYKRDNGILTNGNYNDSINIGNITAPIKLIYDRFDLNNKIFLNKAISVANLIRLFHVFTVQSNKIFLDIVKGTLSGGKRIQAVQGKLRNISKPFAVSPNSKSSIVTWIEFDYYEISQKDKPDFIPNRSDSHRSGDYSDIIQGLEKDAAEFGRFIVKVAVFDRSGNKVKVKIIKDQSFIPNTFYKSLKNTISHGVISSPRIKKTDKGYLLTWTANTEALWVAETDVDFNLVTSNSIQNPTQLPLEPDLDFKTVNQNSSFGYSLEDFMEAEIKSRFICLVSNGNKLVVENFDLPSRGISNVQSQIKPEWKTEYYNCKGAVLKGDKNIFMLILSNRGQNGELQPKMIKYEIQNSKLIATQESIYLIFPGLPKLAKRFVVHEVMNRNNDGFEFLFSLSGYFKDSDISSSLFKVGYVLDSKDTQNTLVHNSGFGDYEVCQARNFNDVLNNTVFWKNISSIIFRIGIYSQFIAKANNSNTTYIQKGEMTKIQDQVSGKFSQ